MRRVWGSAEEEEEQQEEEEEEGEGKSEKVCRHLCCKGGEKNETHTQKKKKIF